MLPTDLEYFLVINASPLYYFGLLLVLYTTHSLSHVICVFPKRKSVAERKILLLSSLMLVDVLIKNFFYFESFQQTCNSQVGEINVYFYWIICSSIKVSCFTLYRDGLFSKTNDQVGFMSSFM